MEHLYGRREDLVKAPIYPELGDMLRPVLETSTILGQNIKYDFGYLLIDFGIRLRRMRDMMLMAQVEKAGDKNSNSLGSLCYRYFKGKEAWFETLTGFSFQSFLEFKEAEQKSRWQGELTPEQLKYAAQDVRLLFPLYDAICDSLDEFVNNFERTNDPDRTVYNAILLECNAIPVYAMMELRGVCLDKEYLLKEAEPYLNDKMKEAETLVKPIFNRQVKNSNGLRGKARQTWFETECINLNSPPQVKKCLTEAGVELPINAKTKKPAAGLEELEKIRDKHPAIPGIIMFKKAKKFKSFIKSWVQICYNCGDCCIIYADWWQIGSEDALIDTGRSCCKKPNLQQVPNRDDSEVLRWGITAADLMRRAFVARPGFVFIDADYSEFEPRIAAEYCNEKGQIAEFRKELTDPKYKVDTHALTAMAMFGLKFLPTKAAAEEAATPAEKAKIIALRGSGKILNLGIGYGMGAKKLAAKLTEETGIYHSEEDAKKLIKAYYANLPGVLRVKKRIEAQVRLRPEAMETLAVFKGGVPIYVEFTMTGRPRRWCLKHTPKQDQEAMAWDTPHLLRKDAKGGAWNNIYNERLSEISREAYNFIIQGTNADLLKRAVVMVQEGFDAAGFDPLEEGIIMVIHDEILAEVKIEHKEQALEIIHNSMKKAGETVLKQVPVKIGIATGPNWAIGH